MVEQFIWLAAVTCLSLILLRGLQQDLSLVVWVAGLWSYSPPRNPDGKMEMETKSDKAGIIALTSPRYFSLGQDP